MNRLQFFEDANGGYVSFSHPKHFIKTWKKVKTFEDNIGKTLDDGYTKEEYISLFNFMLARCSSSFYNDKKVVMYYIRYLIAHDALPAEQEDILASVVVEDLSIKAADRVDETMYDVPSAILYLAWYGLSEEQVLTLPKSAVLEDGIMLDDQKIEMPHFITDLLVRLRDAEGFSTKGRGIIFRKYMYSDYLIRTEDSYQMTVPQMRASLSRMDKVMDHTYSLRFDTARQSGIFYRAYMLECESNSFDLSDPVFASKVFSEDFTKVKIKADPGKQLRQRVRDYTLYKQLFS